MKKVKTNKKKPILNQVTLVFIKNIKLKSFQLIQSYQILKMNTNIYTHICESFFFFFEVGNANSVHCTESTFF